MILTPERRKRAMTFIFITVFLDMVGFGIIIPVVPALLQDVGHVDLSQAAIISGWMFAGYSLAQFAFGPVMGNLSDAYGRRPLLLLAIGGLMVDYVFSALAPSVGYLYVGRIVAGLCGASYVIANAFIADITEPEDRA
ncbi:MAG: MFS transporter, partial [Rhodobacteraceae bacterium]|nr:MFS transporter [Paracoccaceae bacterium]